jgi:cell wall-associated NlpC family hydrolase
MKKSILFFLLLSSIFSFSQTDSFSILLEQNKNNTTTYTKLKTFKSVGMGKVLVLDSVTPQQLIDTAKLFLGTKYKFGGTSRAGIDCSGLLYASFTKLGVKITRSSEDIARFGNIILDIDSLKPGDLMFFIGTYKTSKLITHSAIYIGDYQIIHAVTKRGVVISDIRDDYYKKHYIFSTRIFADEKTSQ